MRVLLALLALGVPLATVPAQQGALNLERIFGTSDFRGDLQTIRWMPTGGAYTVLRTGDSGTSDLIRVDAESGDETILVRGTELVPPGGGEPIEVESYTFSDDGTRLLLFTNSLRVWRQNTKGTYYVWDLTADRMQAVSDRPGHQMFAKFSPDGQSVGFVRDNDIFVTHLETGVERRLTMDGSDVIINGTSDWVYEEELRLRDAFRFSPDGRRVAFWRFDQSPIEPFYLIDETVLYPELTSVRYPKAGVANSVVQLGVVDVAGGETQWVDLGGDDVYIAAMDFADSADEIWFTRLNRHQNRLDLLLADVHTGESRIVMSDSDAAWVDANQPLWIEGGRRFLFRSERDGVYRVHLFDRDGTHRGALTPPQWDVVSVIGVDEDRHWLFVTGVGEGPLERHLYRVGLDGRGLRRLTQAPGTHTATFDPASRYYVDTYSRAAVPPTQTLYRADGGRVRTIEDNAELRAAVRALALSPPEFFSVPAADGTPLNGWIIRPPDFDSSQAYPLLLYVYGGPRSQTVRDSWGGARYLWHQLLAQEGYLVASIDNRGTGWRGREFTKQVYQRLGQLEFDDQMAAAEYLASRSSVDGTRIGIWGWSYGGYMSSLSLLRGAGTFKAAVAVAPVTDWRLYDTIYTERYMRTPQENPEGYERGAPLTYADRLDGRLLLVHGTGDDNVHAQNTTQLVERLEAANKQFDLRLYPNKTHSIAGRTTQWNLYALFTAWLKENL